jgi:hypothetical protein
MALAGRRANRSRADEHARTWYGLGRA